jgi:hypothetical protein
MGTARIHKKTSRPARRSGLPNLLSREAGFLMLHDPILRKSNPFIEPLSKRFSLVKLKAGDDFNRRNIKRISRIEI